MLYVTSVEIVQTSVEPKLDIIRVIGLASLQGWREPELVPTFVGKSLDDELDLQFIATVPLQSQPAEGFVRWGPFSRSNRITRSKACACAPPRT